jgi:murein L,D-transpeptidase YcbB/YkuD
VHKLLVSYNGSPVDPSRSIGAAAIFSATPFCRRRAPQNVLGKAKFLFPNRHTVYMHDTLPVRKKYFKQPVRMIGHECIRMEKPQQFAAVLLAEGNGWPASKVKALWDGAPEPCRARTQDPGASHLFHRGRRRRGKLSTFADVYGLDNKMPSRCSAMLTVFQTPA